MMCAQVVETPAVNGDEPMETDAASKPPVNDAAENEKEVGLLAY